MQLLEYKHLSSHALGAGNSNRVLKFSFRSKILYVSRLRTTLTFSRSVRFTAPSFFFYSSFQIVIPTHYDKIWKRRLYISWHWRDKKARAIKIFRGELSYFSLNWKVSLLRYKFFRFFLSKTMKNITRYIFIIARLELTK